MSVFVFFTLFLTFFSINSFALSSSRSANIPSGGTIRSDVWRQSSGWWADGSVKYGNSLLWDYQISAVYSGSKSVEWIKTAWTGSVSLNNSASFSMGVSKGSVSVGASSSWQYVSISAYWLNSNGAKSSSYRQTMVAAPSMDYRNGSVNLNNTATVKIKNDGTLRTILAAI